ncbi:MAG: GNAT family N-acetyltransferase [Caulobacteraceae bacterium]
MIDLDRIRREAETPVVGGREDTDGVADDLSAAFSNDVMFDWFLRTDARRDAGRRRFFDQLLRVVAGDRARIDRPAHGGAAAVWLPFSAVGPVSLIDELRLAPMILAATGFSRISRLLALQNALESRHPKDRPHAYLWFLGVRPEAQGLGVGSRLLRVASERLDAARMAAYLETQTERNVGLYRRHGFEVTTEFRARRDAPLMWAMWREPKLL